MGVDEMGVDKMVSRQSGMTWSDNSPKCIRIEVQLFGALHTAKTQISLNIRYAING